MRLLLVIEDGSEYSEFARLYLADAFTIVTARSAAEALAALAAPAGADVLLVDLRFDRAPVEALVGDVEATARRVFGGDRDRALRHLQDEQGTLILSALRAAGHTQRAVFVADLPPRRLENLRRLYGDVDAVPSFDAAALREVLGG
jgi:CheY-like chemotaxis protein